MNPGDSCTPVYGLPYATGNSDPCNIGSTGCAFAEAVEAQLDALDAITDRFSGVPFAYASNIAQISYDNSIPGNFTPFFDTTIADTDGMIDLALNPSVITIQTEGVYSFFVELGISVSLGGTQLSAQLNINNASGATVEGTQWSLPRFTSSPSMPARTNGDRVANNAFTAEWIANCDPGYTASLNIFVTSPGALVSFVQVFRMGAIWLRESL